MLAGAVTPGGAFSRHDLLGLAAKEALEKLRRDARSSFHNYARFCMRDQEGNAVEQAVIHRVMHLHVEECWAAGLHAAVLAPFAHGKTIQLSVGRTTYEIGKDPGIRAKIICNNDSKAMERTMGCAGILLSSNYRMAFPHVRPVPLEKARREGKQAKWTQHEIFLDRPGQAIDPSIQAAGMLSGGTGGRCDLAIFDDVVDRKNAIDEPGNRVKVIGAFEDVWMQRLESWGRALYVGTPWHEADLTHTLFDRPGWSVLKIWVSEDFERLEMEVYNPPNGYPLPRVDAQPNGAGGWVSVKRSSNVRQVRHHGGGLEVRFKGGAVYRYERVPREIFSNLLAAESVGAYLNAVIKGRFPHQRVEAREADR